MNSVKMADLHFSYSRTGAIAFASLSIVQALIDMEDSLSELHTTADQLGANLYRLTN